MHKETPKLICVIGARPNFVKITPLLQALSASQTPIETTLVHTGQHYDAALDAEFCASLQLPAADYYLGVGSGSQAAQTAYIMLKFEPILEKIQPHAILVVGDVNSTIACSLVAAKQNIPIVHVEAGLRSFDKSMPEEINRIVTDHLSSLLFTTESSANDNLQREGIDPTLVHFVGNIMIDTMQHFVRDAISPVETFKKYNLSLGAEDEYALITLHRASNVDQKSTLRILLDSFKELSTLFPVLLPLHPRTQNRLDTFGWLEELKQYVITAPPLNYLEMLGCMKHAKIVLTDSGGVQEETTMLQVPCITLRDNTERPVTISEGTNRLIGRHARLMQVVKIALEAPLPKLFPKFWDGKTAERITSILIPWLYQLRKKATQA